MNEVTLLRERKEKRVSAINNSNNFLEVSVCDVLCVLFATLYTTIRLVINSIFTCCVDDFDH